MEPWQDGRIDEVGVGEGWGSRCCIKNHVSCECTLRVLFTYLLVQVVFTDTCSYYTVVASVHGLVYTSHRLPYVCVCVKCMRETRVSSQVINASQRLLC